MRIKVPPDVEQALLSRAGRRCECHGHDCRHHRAGARCSHGLRGQGWHAIQRSRGAGLALWNLTAVCDGCWKVIRDREAG
ncbi:MAG: hypothetical protein ACE5GJ_12395 [Gemmatimonadota bacterium]